MHLICKLCTWETDVTNFDDFERVYWSSRNTHRKHDPDGYNRFVQPRVMELRYPRTCAASETPLPVCSHETHVTCHRSFDRTLRSRGSALILPFHSNPILIIVLWPHDETCGQKSTLRSPNSQKLMWRCHSSFSKSKKTQLGGDPDRFTSASWTTLCEAKPVGSISSSLSFLEAETDVTSDLSQEFLNQWYRWLNLSQSPILCIWMKCG